MKFLQNPRLEQISARLCVDGPVSHVDGRLESYSLKLAGQDKKLYKEISQGDDLSEIMALSPPQTIPYGPLKLETCSKRVLCHLIATLNASFPDYDFTNLQSTQFSREPNLEAVVFSVNNTLLESMGEQNFAPVRSELWEAIDKEIGIRECEIYTYIPALDADPYADEGSLWSFNYFFYNKKLNRLLFFTCRSLSPSAYHDAEMDVEMSGEYLQFEGSDLLSPHYGSQGSLAAMV
eukprot:Colp12_sorted_trinity150504_noHs@34386